MLVYANALKVEGEDAFLVAGRAIHGWLSQQIGHVPYADIFKPGQWKSGENRQSAWLRAYATADDTPELYAWRLAHSDEEVRGRQWQVEIGVKRELGSVEVSCTVKTDEFSVLVTAPVCASRPRLIQYLLDNLRDDSEARLAADVPGKAHKVVGKYTDGYRALLVDIENPERDYPIVLVSPKRGQDYPLSPEHLQEALVGLAQVVAVDKNFDSYEMESVLTQQYSAWDGAINLIRTPAKAGQVRSRLFRSNEIDEWGDRATEKISNLLAFVTHNTNVPRQRRRIRPDGVAQLALKRRLQQQRLRPQSDNLAELKAMNEELFQELDELTERNEELQGDLDREQLAHLQIQEDKDVVDDELRRVRYRIRSLSEQMDGPKGNQALDVSEFMSIACRPDEPTPEECLQLIESVYPRRVIILDSAYESARDRSMFASGRRLLGLLNRLCTDFIDRVEESGDGAAFEIFTTSEYAATESESTRNNGDMRARRTFVYKGQPIEMWRHLKIGVADDQRRSIRVYFGWLPDERRVVIAHCGEHLPVVSH